MKQAARAFGQGQKAKAVVNVNKSKATVNHRLSQGFERKIKNKSSAGLHDGYRLDQDRLYARRKFKHGTWFVADIFGGCAGVAKSVINKGSRSRVWDINIHAVGGDLTHPKSKRAMKRLVRQGFLFSAMLAPPCSSLSPARDRTYPIRAPEDPWGKSLPRIAADEEKVAIGNVCLEATLEILEYFCGHNIPWIWENAQRSKMWFVPEVLQFKERWRKKGKPICDLQLDQCQFDAKWKKTTTLLCFGISSQDLQSLARRCQPCGKVCSRSGREHFQLTGSTPQGIPWTRVAASYPQELYDCLGKILTELLRDAWMHSVVFFLTCKIQ